MAANTAGTGVMSGAGSNDDRFIDIRVMTQLLPPHSTIHLHRVKATSTIAELKEHVRQALPTRPPPETMKFIHRGHRVRNDAHTLEAVLSPDAIQPGVTHVLHLVLQGPNPPNAPHITPAVPPAHVTGPRPRSTGPVLQPAPQQQMFVPQNLPPHGFVPPIPMGVQPLPAGYLPPPMFLPQMVPGAMPMQQDPFLLQAQQQQFFNQPPFFLPPQIAGMQQQPFIPNVQPNGMPQVPAAGDVFMDNINQLQAISERLGNSVRGMHERFQTMQAERQAPQVGADTGVQASLNQPNADLESSVESADAVANDLQSHLDRLRERVRSVNGHLDGQHVAAQAATSRTSSQMDSLLNDLRAMHGDPPLYMPEAGTTNNAEHQSRSTPTQLPTTESHFRNLQVDSQANNAAPQAQSFTQHGTGPNGINWTFTSNTANLPFPPQANAHPIIQPPSFQPDIRHINWRNRPIDQPDQALHIGPPQNWLSASHTISQLTEILEQFRRITDGFWRLVNSAAQSNEQHIQHELYTTLFHIKHLIKRRNAWQQLINEILTQGPSGGHSAPSLEQITAMQVLGETFNNAVTAFDRQRQRQLRERRQSRLQPHSGDLFRPAPEPTVAYLLASPLGPHGLVYTQQGTFTSAGTTADGPRINLVPVAQPLVATPAPAQTQPPSTVAAPARPNPLPPNFFSPSAPLEQNLSNIRRGVNEVAADLARNEQFLRQERENLRNLRRQDGTQHGNQAEAQAMAEAQIEALTNNVESLRRVLRNADSALQTLEQANGMPVRPILQANGQVYPDILAQNLAHNHANGHGNGNDPNVRAIAINLTPFFQALWFFIRIYGVMWILLGGVATRMRIGILMVISVAYWAVQAGVGAQQIAQLRTWWESLVGPGLGNANVGAGPNAGADAGNARPQGQPQVADAPRNTFREAVRPVEQTLALLFASLWPGVGERTVAERERVRREEAEREVRRRREEEQARTERDAAAIGSQNEQGVVDEAGEASKTGTATAATSAGGADAGTGEASSTAVAPQQDGQGSLTARRTTGTVEGSSNSS